jgi:hypothetical protein
VARRCAPPGEDPAGANTFWIDGREGGGAGDTRSGLPRGLPLRGCGQEGLGDGAREGARVLNALDARAAVGVGTRRGLRGRLATIKTRAAEHAVSGREGREEECVAAPRHLSSRISKRGRATRENHSGRRLEAPPDGFVDETC